MYSLIGTGAVYVNWRQVASCKMIFKNKQVCLQKRERKNNEPTKLNQIKKL